jgi:hypothetical protein
MKTIMLVGALVVVGGAAGTVVDGRCWIRLSLS